MVECSALVPELADGRIDFGADRAHRSVDAVGQGVHSGGNAEDYQGNDRRVFHEILPVLVLDHIQHQLALQI